MKLSDFWRRFVCIISGHEWDAYHYPRSDGWFTGPHWRRECARCGADEALRTDR